MSREQCPVCSASDLEELIALEEYPYAGNGAVKPEHASEVPLGTLSIAICRVCGFLFQWNPVSSSDLDGMLLRQPKPLSPRETGMEEAETRRFLDSLARYTLRGGRVLDVGCGTGYLMEHFRGMGYDALGVDAHPEAVNAARSLGFEVYQGRFEPEAFEEESFDLIVARSALEHILEPDTMLSAMEKLLKPGGMLAVEVPNAARVFRRNGFGGFSFHHLNYWSVPTLRYALTLQGLDVVGGHEEYYLALFSRKAKRSGEDVSPVPPSDEDVEHTLEDLDRFLERKERLAEDLVDMIHARYPNGIAVFGAGAPTVDLLYYTGLEKEIGMVLTSDKARYGAILAGSRFTIEPLGNLERKATGAVLVSSERRQEELIEHLSGYRDRGGQVIRMAPEIEII